MTEGIPPEGTQPLTRAQIRQLQRDLSEQVLDKAESDPEWRELFLDDPELAMREANFPAAQQLVAAAQEAEVMGQEFSYGLQQRKNRGAPSPPFPDFLRATDKHGCYIRYGSLSGDYASGGWRYSYR